jgi:hypothetical protein
MASPSCADHSRNETVSTHLGVNAGTTDLGTGITAAIR